MSAGTRLAIGAVALTCAFSHAGHAIVLDWSALTWTSGATSQSFDIDSSPSAPGNDVTITLGGSTGELANDSVNNLPTPQVNANQEGGQGAGTLGLNLAMDLGKKDRSISIVIQFAPHYTLGVENVSFTIFGIDSAAGGSNLHIDEIRSMTGILADGVTVVTPTITNVGSAVSFTGSGLSQTLTGVANVPGTGAGSGAGNATISFNTSGLRSISLMFGAGGNAAFNPLHQQISFSDVNFSPVPEINPALAAGGICIVGFAGAFYRRRKLSRPATPG